MDANAKLAEDSPMVRGIRLIADILEAPIIWFREKVVLPNRREYAWYHEVFPRVPTVDECYRDDPVCIFEAEQQFKRDRKVDQFILTILKNRYHACGVENERDKVEMCKPLYDEWQNNVTNYFIKYGDLGYYGSCMDAYMKQKHRMAWERLHGPVGTGMKSKEYRAKKREKKC